MNSINLLMVPARKAALPPLLTIPPFPPAPTLYYCIIDSSRIHSSSPQAPLPSHGDIQTGGGPLRPERVDGFVLLLASKRWRQRPSCEEVKGEGIFIFLEDIQLGGVAVSGDLWLPNDSSMLLLLLLLLLRFHQD
ncbi:hypothetical protein EYF80_026040 [Liparis tanakae]|uniref:Uncharacterized protein n=1 Tax=Liparis tanakae TaxID=230148 RepID=A0A4Z2HFG4_9TELE|nr:hypothetical protein EYF80_026040 [Liparis tanakae]